MRCLNTCTGWFMGLVERSTFPMVGRQIMHVGKGINGGCTMRCMGFSRLSPESIPAWITWLDLAGQVVIGDYRKEA